MNFCKAGHKIHKTKTVKSIIGNMVVYDYSQYKGYAGYCTGQDSTSETIEKTGSWDIHTHHRIEKILDKGDKSGMFIDIGCHLGYFSKLAFNIGYEVIGFDGDPENIRLFSQNAPKAKGISIWFDKKMGAIEHIIWSNIIKNKIVEVMKLDIEGSEKYAIKYFTDLFKKKLVKNIIIEVSPCFNNSYPALIQKMVNYRFEILELNGKKFDFNYDFHQKDLWLKL